MSHAIRAALACAALAPLASSQLARAVAAPTGLHSGGTLQWAGSQPQAGAPPTASNTNQISISPGSNAMINGVFEVPVSAQCIETKHIAGVVPVCAQAPVFCVDTGGAQVASSFYYVYYAAYLVTSVTHYAAVISQTAPGGEGAPTAAIQFTIGANPQTTTQAAVFLGSYLTDVGANVIPFQRQGAEVILEPQLAGGVPAASVVFPFAAKGAVTRAFRLMPATTAGVILDFQVVPVANALLVPPAQADFFVLDPVLNAFAANPNSQHHLWFPGGGNKIQHDHQWIKTLPGNSNVTLELIANPAVAGTSFNVNVNLVGYVEPVSHLF